MVTLNYGFSTSKTQRRNRQDILKAASFVEEANEIANIDIQLERDESHTVGNVEGIRLFALVIEDAACNVAITVGSNTITLNVLGCLLIPFSSEDTVGIVISNPSDNPIQLPSSISYVTA
jgi:hypothetical protein